MQATFCVVLLTIFHLLAIPAIVIAGNVQPAASRPNVILILADDLGVNDLHCYGRTDHLTPQLDRLASEGVRFTFAYPAQPICSPSRPALMPWKAPASDVMKRLEATIGALKAYEDGLSRNAA